MSTSKKLWLGFGTLTALLVVSMVAILVRVHSIRQQVERHAVVTRPRNTAARELELNVLDYTLALRAAVYNEDPQGGREVARQAEDVERYLSEYINHADTDRQQQLAAGFAARWARYREFAQSLLEAPTERPTAGALAQIHEHRMELERFLDEELQVDGARAYNASRDATVRDLRTVTGFSLILLTVGTVIAVATSVAVGRGVLHSAEELQRSYDQMEDRVHERTAELAAAIEALQRSNRELEQFASVASHDLQEPLRKIQAFGDRLQAKFADALGGQGRDYVQRMQASAARMRNLIDALLTFSRVTTKAQPFVPVDLAEAAEDAVSDLESRIQRSDGRVEVGALPTIDADPLQMRQLLQNLVGNGLKFHRPGVPPVVQVEGRLIDGPEGNGAGQLCEITVRDNGIGFEEVYLDRIFEVFQRLHGRQEFEGTGMGLSICRKIVERHGGSINATSAPGQGATFTATIPARQTQEETHVDTARQADHDPDG